MKEIDVWLGLICTILAVAFILMCWLLGDIRDLLIELVNK